MNLQKLTIVGKEKLAPDVYLFRLQMEKRLDYFPGQHVVLQVEPRVFRSYSIVEIENGEPAVMVLIVDVRPAGPASVFFENAREGSALNLVGAALGRFIVHDNDCKKVFVATGTGLAPFIPMIKAALQSRPEAEITLFFGVRHLDEDYCARFYEGFANNAQRYPNFRIYPCISKPERDLPEGYLEGRVTAHVPKMMKDFRETDFYICGNPAMVDELKGLLTQNGATKIHEEKYA
ncbi:MAG TPA: FAD-binding oxidoreductase [Candidatus Gracilibacteria bacterium]|nr:FAD-binding oxidoreductase [Candidatus Gracilibacteria bacterium]